MNMTRINSHKWKQRNRVILDAGKEHVAIIHPVHGEGNDFKALASMLDVKLSKQIAVESILNKGRPKISGLLPTRGVSSSLCRIL